jgi:hypothetical protein
MKIIEYKEVTKREKVVVAYKCDNCGKLHNSDERPDDWHEFSGHHNSWGNDSCESYIHYMACSPECYAKLLQKAVEDFEDYSDAKIDDFTIDFAKRMAVFLNTQ